MLVKYQCQLIDEFSFKCQKIIISKIKTNLHHEISYVIQIKFIKLLCLN